MIPFTAGAAVFAVLFLAAAWEPRTRPAGQHVARLLAALLLAATLRLTHPEARP